MIDKDHLEKILASWKRADSNSFMEFYQTLLTEFTNVQAGLFTSNDFTQIRFLQGIGAILSLFISTIEKLAKIDYNFNEIKK